MKATLTEKCVVGAKVLRTISDDLKIAHERILKKSGVEATKLNKKIIEEMIKGVNKLVVKGIRDVEANISKKS